jgi:hypothetical protein
MTATGAEQIAEDGSVTQLSIGMSEYETFFEWLVAGGIPENAIAASEPTLSSYESAVQALMDAKAQAYGYDSLMTAVTYADEPAVPKFQTEGQAFRAWRSLVWQAAHDYLADIQAGHAQFPSLDQIPALFPPFPLDPVTTGA